MNDGQDEIIVCECASIDHQMVLRTITPEDPEVYISVNLVKRPFLYRLKYGLKYIFGYQCNYGAFDEFIFNKEDLKQKVNNIK